MTCTCTADECREDCRSCDPDEINLDCPATRWEDMEDAMVYLGKREEQHDTQSSSP